MSALNLDLAHPPHIASLKTSCSTIAHLAIRSLHAELSLYPKPGLVSPMDNGSHSDMSAATFMRSLFSLRHYFRDIACAGAAAAGFESLKRLGIAAERRMLRVTGGINTHRGAIFSLGLLCASMARLQSQGLAMTAPAIRSTLLAEWGNGLAAHTQDVSGTTHGLQVAAQHAAAGAREEAALGLPSLFDIALPRLQQTLAAGRDVDAARIDALFALMAHVSDTNVYHRGGVEGALMVREQARSFLERGGTAQDDWQTQALLCHRLFVAHKLSPGGAADLLAATCLVQMAVSA